MGDDPFFVCLLKKLKVPHLKKGAKHNDKNKFS